RDAIRRSRGLHPRICQETLAQHEVGANQGRQLMAGLATGIDIGTRAVRIVQGKRKGTAFAPTRYISRPRAEGETAAAALEQALAEAKIRAPRARIGITGRETILR